MSDFDDKTPETPRRLPRTLDDVIPRLVAVETRHEVFKREATGRFNSGSSALAELRQTDQALAGKLDALKEENRVKPWKVVVGSVGFLALFAGAFMAVGEYRANSKHTTDAVQTSSAKIDSLDAKVREMDKEQSVLTEKVNAIGGSVAEIKKAVVPEPKAVVPEPKADALGRPRRAR